MRSSVLQPALAGAVVAAWTALGVTNAFQAVRLSAGTDSAMGIGAALAWQMPQWWAWAALTPIVAGVDTRARRALSTKGVVAVHAGLAAAAILAHSAVVVWADRAFMSEFVREAGFGGAIVDHLEYRAQFELLTYAGLLAALYAVVYVRRNRAQALNAARLETALARAEFRALEGQLQPHFLFNALQAAAGLARRDPEAAHRTLVRLGDLYHELLATGGRQVVPLERELDFLEGYLAIERLRFGDRLTVEVDVAAEARRARVPRLVLQPIVENALRHGIGPRVGPGRVEVRAARENGALTLEVVDDGIGPGAVEDGSEGRGLDLTRRRLAALYGEAADLRMGPADGSGTRVVIRLPFEPDA